MGCAVLIPEKRDKKGEDELHGRGGIRGREASSAHVDIERGGDPLEKLLYLPFW